MVVFLTLKYLLQLAIYLCEMQFTSFRVRRIQSCDGFFVGQFVTVLTIAGNDIYLTLDADYQSAAYNILEQKIAGILVSKIQNIKEYKATENSGSADIKVAIYDVYNALIENSVIDISHFSNAVAGETEQKVQEKFVTQEEFVLNKLQKELLEDH